MNRVSTLLVTLLLIMGIAIVPPAKAQTDILVGPRLGLPLGDMSDLQATLFIGAGARIVTESLPVVLNPSFDFYLFDSHEGADQTGFALDLNALYDFEIGNEVFKPYAGGGSASRGIRPPSEVQTLVDSGLAAERRRLGSISSGAFASCSTLCRPSCS
jgi:hypothetical protein